MTKGDYRLLVSYLLAELRAMRDAVKELDTWCGEEDMQPPGTEDLNCIHDDISWIKRKYDCFDMVCDESIRADRLSTKMQRERIKELLEQVDFDD